MKIGKQPKRFGGPSSTFRKHRDASDRARREAEAATIPPTGDVRLYMDDERQCPKGWTLARTGRALLALVDDPALAPRIVSLSLDWHMAERRPDGTVTASMNGEAVATALADRLLADPDMLPALEVVHFHSSDPDRALSMLRTVRGALTAERLEDVHLDVGPAI